MEADDKVSRFGRFAGFWIIWLLASPVVGHPSHSSYAEIEWSDAGELNVALQVIPEDFERALSLATNRPMVLVDSQAVRDAIQTYLADNFYLGDIDSQARLKSTDNSTDAEPLPAQPLAINSPTTEVVVVGMELDYRDTWIYFSIRGDVSRDSTLTNTILFDVQPTQVNRIKALWAPDSATLVFTATEPVRSLVVSSQ